MKIHAKYCNVNKPFMLYLTSFIEVLLKNSVRLTWKSIWRKADLSKSLHFSSLINLMLLESANQSQGWRLKL